MSKQPKLTASTLRELSRPVAYVPPEVRCRHSIVKIVHRDQCSQCAGIETTCLPHRELTLDELAKLKSIRKARGSGTPAERQARRARAKKQNTATEPTDTTDKETENE